MQEVRVAQQSKLFGTAWPRSLWTRRRTAARSATRDILQHSRVVEPMVTPPSKKKSKKIAASPRKATWRPVGGVFELVAAKPLLVRTGASLTSAEVSRLGGGQRMIVLETRDMEEGITRARIALDGQQAAYGWITSVAKDGTPQLRSMAPPSAAADLINLTSRVAAPGPSSSAAAAPAAGKARSPPLVRKTAANAAASKKSSRDRKQQSQSTRASLRVELSVTVEPLEQSSSSLLSAAAVLVQQAEEIETQGVPHAKGVPSLTAQLGEALHKLAVTPDRSREKMFELLELFGDRNGDSKVSRMEVRLRDSNTQLWVCSNLESQPWSRSANDDETFSATRISY